MDHTDTHAEGNKKKVQLVTAFILGLIVGILVAPTFFGSPSADEGEEMNEDEQEMTDNSGETDEPIDERENAVSVNDQVPGDRVMLDEVAVATSTWVVVHEDLNGVVGNALGAQRFDAGASEEGYVQLLRDTEPGSTYYVLLYADNGDGEFDLDADSVVPSTGESPVFAEFSTITVERNTM